MTIEFFHHILAFFLSITIISRHILVYLTYLKYKSWPNRNQSPVIRALDCTPDISKVITIVNANIYIYSWKITIPI